MRKVRQLGLLAATMSVSVLSGCSRSSDVHVSGTYSDLSRSVVMRFGGGRVQFGSSFGALVRQKGGSDRGKYTVKGNTVTVTYAMPGGNASFVFQIEKDGCLYSKKEGEFCKQK